VWAMVTDLLMVKMEFVDHLRIYLIFVVVVVVGVVVFPVGVLVVVYLLVVWLLHDLHL
jgi:hypothetical protein